MFGVQAGFEIGGIYTAFLAGLNSKRPASLETNGQTPRYTFCPHIAIILPRKALANHP